MHVQKKEVKYTWSLFFKTIDEKNVYVWEVTV